MRLPRTDTGVLVLSALSIIALHTLTNSQYGFHRDELATVDDARYLSWGYVAYPPVTPFIARVSLELFGTSLTGLRFFAVLAQGIAIVLAGLMAREFGGKRPAQIVAAWASAIAPVAAASGTMFQYVSFDHLWWVLTAYLIVRMLKSGNPRWWLGVGLVAGLGMMTKYTMAFLVAGILGGILLTDARRHLASKWLWLGAAISILIFLPNLIWQVQHGFISLDFLKSIHARDVRLGRTDGFLLAQFWKSTNIVTVPLWLAGLYYVGKRYSLIAWMFVIPLALLFLAKGRDYYFAPAFPVLLAAGAVWGEQWVETLSATRARRIRRAVWTTLAISGVLLAAAVLPLAPAGSGWFRVADAVNGNFNEEFGWPEMTEAVARVRDSIRGDTAALGILAGDAGEAGALNLYGRARGLPTAISGSNSHWLRGYGDPPPQIVITAGFRLADLEPVFAGCTLAEHFNIPFGIRNSAIGDNTEIFLCQGPRQPWHLLWRQFRWFG